MLQAGLEPPRVDWSPSRAPTATRVFALSFQQALKLSNIIWNESGSRGSRSRGQRWAEHGKGTSRELSPSRGTVAGVLVPGPWQGRCQRSCAGAVPRGRAAAVLCLASPHLSGIRCSIAGNSQRIPALNCSRLSSFSQGLSRCVGDAG